MSASPLDRYNSLRVATGLEEYNEAKLRGMECKFCKKSESRVSYILVYEDICTLNQIITDEVAFANFNRDLYLLDMKANESFGEVYIIFIVSDDTMNIPVQKIEANKTYARKYVFLHNEAITFINGVRADTGNGLSGVDDPVHIWADILGKIGLTGCLTETYFSKNVISYLQGEDFNSLTLFEDEYDSNDSDRIPQIKWIKSLDTKGFRTFCFDDKKMNFGQINLFYGANGAGKSSVLEAIEFALTSEIRRMSDFKIKYNADKYPVVDVYDREAGILHFTPKFANKNAKQIEKSWYGVPISRNRPTLSHSFARFNSFDSEAAYNFIHNTDSSSNSFSVAFGNLMFGENVVDCEKKWSRYKTAFSDSIVTIQKEIDELELALTFNKELLENCSTVNLSSDIESTLDKIGYKRKHELPNEVIERYSCLEAELSIISEVIKPFDDFPDYVGKDILAILAQLKSIKIKSIELAQKKARINEKIEANNIELRSIAAERLQIAKECEASNQTYSALFTSECNWYSSERLLEERKSLALFDKLSERKYQIESKLESITALKENKYVSGLFAGKKFLPLPPKEIEEAEIRKNKADELLQILESEYLSRKALLSAQEAEWIEIKRLGKILAGSGKCPLCGHEYYDNSELMCLIDNSGTLDNEMAKVIRSIAEQKAIVFQCESITKFNNLRNSAITALKEMSGLVPEIDEFGINLEKIAAFIDSESKLRADLDETNSRLATLEKQGFSFMEVANARNYKYCDGFYLEYDAIQGRKKPYDEWLSTKKEKAAKTLEEWQKHSEKLDEKRVSIDDENSLLQIEVEKVDIQIQGSLSEKAYAFETALNGIGNYFSIIQSTILVEWIMEFKQLQTKVCTELRRLRFDTDYGKAKAEIERASKELLDAKMRKERAETAVYAFESMPLLSSFVEGSICENIEKISKFFKWMHHSGEFTSLEVDSQGIYAIRGLGHDVVRTYEMSTGQRSAMALSVMLAFHSTAVSAPQFLLLDEPLATMDDIQVLNVLDILKSLAQNGTQVFFTTANEQMIRLFKQAFANTDLDYKEYEFVKRIGNASVISEKSVNEAHTIEELTMNDITFDFSQFAEIRRILERNREKLTTTDIN